ncbi:hypothetical protein B0H14DRAFT_3474410 [Mycena olivaceomarginata]|nr:hypothetical protein B0H14DRAFT_3474410 [Mycena olivaceomarginata]
MQVCTQARTTSLPAVNQVSGVSMKPDSNLLATLLGLLPFPMVAHPAVPPVPTVTIRKPSSGIGASRIPSSSTQGKHTTSGSGSTVTAAGT